MNQSHIGDIKTNTESYRGGRCFNIMAQIYAGSAVNTTFDLVVFVLPIPRLLQVQISNKKKAGVCMTFLVSIAVTTTLIETVADPSAPLGRVVRHDLQRRTPLVHRAMASYDKSNMDLQPHRPLVYRGEQRRRCVRLYACSGWTDQALLDVECWQQVEQHVRFTEEQVEHAWEPACYIG